MEVRTKWHVSPALCIVVVISLFTIPIKWIAAWIFAVILHEGAHYFTLRFTGYSVLNIVLGVGGAKMTTMPIEGWRETLCAASGPLVSLSLGFLAAIFPRLALCGVAHGLFNLLPLYPMDGGRILNGIIGRFRFGRPIMFATEWITIIGCSIAALYACFKLVFGPIPLILFTVVLLQRRKIPCKQGQIAVQ